MKVKATKEEKREIMLRVGLGPRRQKKRFIINFWCKMKNNVHAAANTGSFAPLGPV